MAILKNTTIDDTGYFKLSTGTTAQRPASPQQGYARYNLTTQKFEFANSSNSWVTLGNSFPVKRGLTVLLDGNSWDTTNNNWRDISGNGNNTTNTTGTINVGTYAGSGAGSTKTFRYIYGNTSAGIRIANGWNGGGNYTFLHITRYTGGARERIWTGVTGNWLSGFHGGGSGKFFHEGWMSSSSTDYHGNDWVLTLDQNTFARTNRGANTFASGGNFSPASIGINGGAGWTGELSDWACAFVAVFNRNLTSDEYTSVENWMYDRYF